MTLRTSHDQAGPYLVISRYPPGTTEEQILQGLQAAHEVFEAAGVDPVEAGLEGSDDPERAALLATLWEAAERAATEFCWAPRLGVPEPTRIMIFVE